MKPLVHAVLLGGIVSTTYAQTQDPKDPFAGVSPAAPATPAPDFTEHSWLTNLFRDNFAFKKEIMSEVDVDETGNGASRQSLGFEVLKRFSNSTSTVASFDFQGRLVRRDGYNPVPNDMDGAMRPGWSFEVHNLYVDLYNILNPVLGEDGRRRNVGRFNFRAGHFYVPFGLNLQTDTHGTLLQLSNSDNFGFERDWYAGFWGAINSHLNYDAYYMAGSGYDLKFHGQSGLGALRISLSNRYSSEYGLEAGLSVIGGERLAAPAVPGQVSESVPLAVVRTQRAGLDGRYRRSAPRGLLTFTAELSDGRDGLLPSGSMTAHGMSSVTTQLGQAEYMRSSRRWSLATQFHRFGEKNAGTNSAIIGEFTWYFRNDVANSTSHWIKLNVQRELQSAMWQPHTVVTLQYYFYF